VSNPIKTGIIGFGKMAEKTHLKNLRRLPELYDVAAVCDTTESRRAAAREHEIPTVVGDLEEFLSQGLELVFITPHSSVHHQLAMPCLERNCHLVIEKPVTITADEAGEIFTAARSKGLMACVYHNRRFDPDYRKVKKLVRERGVGDLILLENRTAGEKPAIGFGVKDFKPEWRISAEMGGGTLFDFGPHWIDQILDLAPGKVVEVFADVRNVKWGDADDYFHVTMVFDSGLRAVASKCDFVYHAPGKWLVYGTEATVWCEAINAEAAHWSNGREEIEETEGVPAPDYFKNYHEVIRNGAEPVIDPRGSLRVMQVIDAARASAAKGKSVEVDI
jgi:scyllo-inositol 2-dehydrogenase (NADP+)